MGGLNGNPGHKNYLTPQDQAQSLFKRGRSSVKSLNTDKRLIFNPG